MHYKIKVALLICYGFGWNRLWKKYSTQTKQDNFPYHPLCQDEFEHFVSWSRIYIIISLFVTELLLFVCDTSHQTFIYQDDHGYLAPVIWILVLKILIQLFIVFIVPVIVTILRLNRYVKKGDK